MKKALVLGASGGMGYSIVNELISRGIAVVAFARNVSKLEQLFKNKQLVNIVQGDLFDKESLQNAANDVDIIYHAANIPYSQWEKKLVEMNRNIVEVANFRKCKLVTVDNIYAYGRRNENGDKVTESKQKNPHTKKGKLRLQAENVVKQSTVPYLIAHFPDFYGPNASNTVLHYTLAGVVKNKSAAFVGSKNIQREFIYTPDGAKALVELSLRDDCYYQNWNIPASGVISGNEIEAILREDASYTKKISTITKGMIQFLGLFSKDMREVVEMVYLMNEPVVLSSEKYEKAVGSLPRTPYRDGIKQTLQFMKENA